MHIDKSHTPTKMHSHKRTISYDIQITTFPILQCAKNVKLEPHI